MNIRFVVLSVTTEGMDLEGDADLYWIAREGLMVSFKDKPKANIIKITRIT